MSRGCQGHGTGTTSDRERYAGQRRPLGEGRERAGGTGRAARADRAAENKHQDEMCVQATPGCRVGLAGQSHQGTRLRRQPSPAGFPLPQAPSTRTVLRPQALPSVAVSQSPPRAPAASLSCPRVRE